MGQIDSVGNIHSDTTGQFTGHVRTEADPGTVLDPARQRIEQLIGSGVLSPAARDMDPREVIDQWAEANASSLWEKERMLATAGLQLQLTAGQLVPGDLVDLEPVIREFGDSDVDASDLMVAETEMATILEPVEDDGALMLHTDQGTWAVPARELLTVQLGTGKNRCSRCGEPIVDAATWNGLCVACAEDKSECPECGRDTSGLNPAENGCPCCGGGTNDCDKCGATGSASYRDDGSVLCQACYEND